MIMEKAFAKLHGSYEAIGCGHADDALNYLTGGVSTSVHIGDLSEAAQWEELLSMHAQLDDDRFPLFAFATLRTGLDMADYALHHEVDGLLDANEFALLGVFESTQGYKLLKLRNPWTATKWQGAFHDQDPIWSGRLMKEVGFEAADDGTFWMEWGDARRYLGRIGLCDSWRLGISSQRSILRGGGSSLLFRSAGVGSSWVADRNAGGMLGSETFSFNPSYLLRCEGACTVHLQLYRVDRRAEGLATELSLEAAQQPPVQLYLVDQHAGKGEYPRAIITMTSRRHDSYEMSMGAGSEYVLVPTAAAAGVEGSFWIMASSTSAGAKLSLVSQAIPPPLFVSAMSV